MSGNRLWDLGPNALYFMQVCECYAYTLEMAGSKGTLLPAMTYRVPDDYTYHPVLPPHVNVTVLFWIFLCKNTDLDVMLCLCKSTFRTVNSLLVDGANFILELTISNSQITI